ncbi:MAG: hypothetical protein AAGC44_02185 [Planctomycetota bacterium]
MTEPTAMIPQTPRTRRQKAYVLGRQLVCPVCGGDSFKAKRYRAAGTFLQTHDLEGFAQEGVMVVCVQCTHILHFKDPKAVTMRA